MGFERTPSIPIDAKRTAVNALPTRHGDSCEFVAPYELFLPVLLPNFLLGLECVFYSYLSACMGLSAAAFRAG